ncbi:MAG: GPW/gp25 family protein [Flavobacteriia bacterium]|nr:GPW/gp25 family protein [Flavobacteriia bacterium]
MEEFTSFLGTGWSFPPSFELQSKSIRTSTNEQDIDESLQILLSTRLGERIMVPEYGSNLEDLLFNPLDLTLKTVVSHQIKTAILYHEPRIDVEKIDISQGSELEGELLILIDYRVRATNSRKNLVFPFYKEEGTDI